ncbi:tRNA (guanine(9)-N(1))-methyltransferase [Malassezia vespertilionis]|uniref:tRNA (guanine(9)-N(1))-methyltransferase n=1 Tax=Malassezia vespertilionis TaxID=2020962 RepID=UPI0024B1A3ED|nr:tRNA (guanine(9)-N(1))-methyltransferase [Malassezia vespertilionis]WFD06303.1 tRNA (guanine(9)-N(1))-methyltransferase [Malassezia vespertilionis]
MFMLKSRDQNNVELIQIPTGALYLVRQEQPQGNRECVYHNAVATIRRTSTSRNYQLVISRAVSEDDKERSDADDEMAFLIDEGLQFYATAHEDYPAFMWRDFADGLADSIEFIMDPRKVNSVTRSIFEVTFLQCAWERKTGRSHEEATDEDLEQLKYHPDGSTKTKQVPDAPDAPAAPAPAAVKPAKPTESLQSITGTSDPQIVLTATADLYLYDQGSGLFMRQEKHVTAKVAEAGRFLYWMVVDGAEAPWLSQAVSSRMNMNFSLENLSSVWNYYDEEHRVFSWLLRFADKDKYTAFQESFSRLLWETLHEESWNKAAPIEQRYVQQAYEQDVAMTPADGEAAEHRTLLSPRHTSALSDDDDADEVEAELDPMDEDDEQFQDAVPEPAPIRAPSDGEVNSQLAVGYKFDRAFVVRGDKIGVFRHTDDDRLEFANSINKISTPKGKLFTPSRVMLHEQDSAMVLMDPNNKHALYRMDLEYGKVVEEWNVNPDVPVTNILPNTKTAQMSADKTLIGTSRNGIFRIDPRMEGNKLVDSQFKLYTTKHDFSAAATDDNGRIAVASNKGDLRLFDQIGKNAKTALPALGDPIIGVDVSSDGRWVVATCRSYLLLIDTLIEDGRYKGSLGFDRSFPADARPLPRRLQLRPHHVAYMEEEVHFTPAHFNVGSNKETSIVTSTGKYVVSWSFEQVKGGNPFAYVLKRFEGTVVRDDYTYGSDQSIVVAFENDVQLAHRTQLRKPTRASLAPGTIQSPSAGKTTRRQTRA